MSLSVSFNQKSGEAFESVDIFPFLNFTRYEVVKEISFFFNCEVWTEPFKHLEPHLIGFSYLCLAPCGGDLGGVGAVVEEGALHIVDLRYTVSSCPETVVFSREGVGAVTQVVVGKNT